MIIESRAENFYLWRTASFKHVFLNKSSACTSAVQLIKYSTISSCRTRIVQIEELHPLISYWNYACSSGKDIEPVLLKMQHEAASSEAHHKHWHLYSDWKVSSKFGDLVYLTHNVVSKLLPLAKILKIQDRRLMQQIKSYWFFRLFFSASIDKSSDAFHQQKFRLCYPPVAIIFIRRTFRNMYGTVCWIYCSIASSHSIIAAFLLQNQRAVVIWSRNLLVLRFASSNRCLRLPRPPWSAWPAGIDTTLSHTSFAVALTSKGPLDWKLQA